METRFWYTLGIAMAVDWPFTLYVADGALLVVDLLDQCQAPLMEAEAELAENVTKTRLRELMAGRSVARRALQIFGMEPTPILSTSDGAPVWPSGFCGSLSHTHRYIAVLLAQTSQYESVGIDIDDGRSLGSSAAVTVVTAGELQVINRAGWVFPESGPENLAFGAKEAIFKCQFPVTLDATLDFLDVRLIDGEIQGTLRMEVVDSQRRGLARLANRLHIQALNAFGVPVISALLYRK